MAGGWTHASVLRSALAAAALAGLVVGRDAPAAGTTTRVSLTHDGGQANGYCGYPFLSATGRYVVFDSAATNLVPGDTNGVRDVFVRDLDTGQTSRVSVSSAGAQANFDQAYGIHPITPDGRFVAFWSESSTLVPNDTNGVADAFIHDRQTGQTSRVSVSSAGAQANDECFTAGISDDGRYVAFGGSATNLVADDTNNATDLFLRDRLAGTTVRISVTAGGQQANGTNRACAITPDASVIAFSSEATNIVPGDTNGHQDVFVLVRATGQVTRVSTGLGGAQSNRESYGASVSADGRYVMFGSEATNLVAGDTNGHLDVFVHDRQTGLTQRANVADSGAQADASCYQSQISRDGRFAGFYSIASTLVPGDTNQRLDAFVRDLQQGKTRRVSVATNGTQGVGGDAHFPAFSADGSKVAFQSGAWNLTPGDTNDVPDVLLHVPSEDPPPPTPCPGDANGDRVVDFLDLNIVLGQFGQSGAPGALEGDVNDDGVCDFIDLNIVLGAFGATC